jgi:hypothetical protein
MHLLYAGLKCKYDNGTKENLVNVSYFIVTIEIRDFFTFKL